MQVKIGTDICSTNRIEKAFRKFGNKFLDRILTPEERKYVLKSHKLLIFRLAGRYAAKEAISKLLGTGIGQELSFQDIEIISGENKEPKVTLTGKAQIKAQELKMGKISLSISHEDSMVVASSVAIFE